jgi:3-oxoacyl-[acyl-carrier protein] reductase
MDDPPSAGPILITGASRGIGAAIATRAAAAGWRVAIGYRDHHDEASKMVDAITAAGGHAVAIAADLSHGGAARGLVQERKLR